MTPERKQELRECSQDRYWDGARYSRSALAECLDEIDRLDSTSARLLAEIGTLRSQLAEQRGPQDIDLDAIGETPDDIEIRSWQRHEYGGQHVAKTDTAMLAWHRDTGLAVLVSDERSMRANASKAVLLLREALAECNTIWRKR